MITNRYKLFLVSLLFFLASCDFFGLGTENDDPPSQPQPELAWQVESFGDTNSPPPIIEGNNVFVTNQFVVASLNISDGEGQWSTELEGVSPRIYGDMLLDDNNLYLRFEKSVTAYDKTDGTERWTVAFNDSIPDLPVTSDISLMDDTDTHLYIGTRENLLIVDKQTGSVEQTITPDIPAETISNERFNIPVADGSADDRVYLLTSYEGDNTASNARIAAYNTSDGSLVWDELAPYPLPSVGSFRPSALQISYADDRIFLLTGPAVIALDVQTGSQAWEKLFVEDRADVNVGNLLVYNPINNFLYAEAANRIYEIDVLNGNLEKSTNILGTGIIENMIVFDNTLYYSIGVSPFDIGIVAFDIERGSSKYSLSPDVEFPNGFTSAFAANDRFLVNIGVNSIFGYELPE